MAPTTPDPREYFTDKDGREYVTALGASLLLDCSRQSVHFPRHDATRMTPRAPRQGRPVQSVISLEDVQEQVRQEHWGEQEGGPQVEATVLGTPDHQAPADQVSSMTEARLRQNVNALTQQNSELKQRLEIVEGLLREHMEATAKLLQLGQESDSAS